MTQARSVSAVFELIGTFRIDVVQAGSATGTVTSDLPGIDCGADCGEVFPATAPVVLTAIPEAGGVFSGWAGACAGVGTCLLQPNDDAIAFAVFDFVGGPYILQVVHAGNGAGSVTSSPPGLACGASCLAGFSDGTAVSLAATASSNSRFVRYDDGCAGLACDLVMNRSFVVRATFEPIGYVVSSVDIVPSLTGTTVAVGVAVDPLGVVAAAGSCSGTTDLGSGSVSCDPTFGTTWLVRSTAPGLLEQLAIINAQNVVDEPVDAAADGSFVLMTRNTGGRAQVFPPQTGLPHNASVYVHGIAMDAAGGLIVVGQYQAGADLGTGALGLASAGGADLFIARYDPATLELLAFVTAGSPGNDRATHVDVNDAGDIIVAGAFEGTLPLGGVPLVSSGGTDVFVARYSPELVRVWSRRAGSAGDDALNSVAASVDGGAAVTGVFAPNFAFQGGALLTSTTPRADIYVGVLGAASGAHVWSASFGGAGSSSYNVAEAVSFTPDGNVVIVGTYGNQFDDIGAIDFGGGQLTSISREEGFVAEFDGATSAHHYSASIHGFNPQHVRDVAVDVNGDVVIVGSTGSGATDFGGIATTTAGGFIARFTPVERTHERVAVLRPGTGAGTVVGDSGLIDCGFRCADGYPIGTSVTLTATPDAASFFSAWNGDCASAGTSPCTLVVDRAMSAGAVFTANVTTLKAVPSGAGAGTIASTGSEIDCGAACSFDFDTLDTVTLVATPAPGSVFQRWGGACSGTTTSCEVVLDGENRVENVLAFFRPLDPDAGWALRLGASGPGYVELRASAASSDERVFVAGLASGTVDFGGAVAEVALVGDAPFVGAFDAAGDPEWIASGESLFPMAATSDTTGLFVAGFTTAGSPGLGGLALAATNADDAWVARVDAMTGETSWGRAFGSSADDRATGVAIAGSDVVVIGYVNGPTDFGDGMRAFSGGRDAFIARYALADGAFSDAQLFDSSNQILGTAIAADALGRLTAAFQLQGTADLDLGSVSSAAGELLLVGFDAAGVANWQRTMTGAVFTDVCLARRPDGTTLVVGVFQGTVNLGGADLVSSGENDALVAAFDELGAPLYSVKFGGLRGENATVLVDRGTDLVIGGSHGGGFSIGTGVLAPEVTDGAFVGFVDPLSGAGIDAVGTVGLEQEWITTGAGAGGLVIVGGGFRGAMTISGKTLHSLGAQDAFLSRLP
ncbi:MAG: hypothetical protein A3J75_01140 [Acidobacteria bacterium RBG_16_68_9]|nr:MAG: hypothetical protein A3J75_01140 [Acidobacteria bacterium RBG_16_68_9]